MNFGAMIGGAIGGKGGGGGLKGLFGGGGGKSGVQGNGQSSDAGTAGTGLAAGMNPLLMQMWGAGGPAPAPVQPISPFASVPPPVQQPFQMQQPQSLPYATAPGQFQSPAPMGDYRGGLYRSIYGY